MSSRLSSPTSSRTSRRTNSHTSGQQADSPRELISLRTAKVAGGSSTKLTRIHDVRKGIAKVLTVINANQRAQLRLFYKGKKCVLADSSAPPSSNSAQVPSPRPPIQADPCHPPKAHQARVVARHREAEEEEHPLPPAQVRRQGISVGRWCFPFFICLSRSIALPGLFQLATHQCTFSHHLPGAREVMWRVRDGRSSFNGNGGVHVKINMNQKVQTMNGW